MLAGVGNDAAVAHMSDTLHPMEGCASKATLFWIDLCATPRTDDSGNPSLMFHLLWKAPIFSIVALQMM